MKNVDIEYYNLSGQELHFKICPGDLQITCNVLYDYCNMLSEMLADPPAEVDKNTIELWKARYDYYLGRVQKIREKIETGIGYSTEKAIEKCNKRKTKKNNDIGEDALVMAMKNRLSQKKEDKDLKGQTETPRTGGKKQVKQDQETQMSLFDIDMGVMP